MEDFIELKLKNDKALLKEQIISEKRFPVRVSGSDNEEITVIFTPGGDKAIFDCYLTELSDFIINRYENKLLKRIILSKYKDFMQYQMSDVLSKIYMLEDDAELGYRARLYTIKTELSEYFKTDKRARVTGLVLFRLPRYIEILEKCSDRMVESFYTEKEYEEFIGLLKYFVNVQGERPKLIHLYVHKYGMYSVLDENNQDITEKCLEDFVGVEDAPYENFDDLLISVLITLAPEKIVIHNCENIKNKELFDTIKRVFEKVEYTI